MVALTFVAEQLVGIDTLTASITPAPGDSAGYWHPSMGGSLGPTELFVSTVDPSYGDPATAPTLTLGTDGAAHVQYEISYASPLTGWFVLASADGSYEFRGEGAGYGPWNLWRIDFGAEWSTCSGHNPASIECYAIGRWVEEADADMPVNEPGFLFLAMVAVAALRAARWRGPVTMLKQSRSQRLVSTS